ncbi:uncharacterized protein MELLADRAFT_114362 [Melampsora larici-populina 98AG31]|uniref:Uncharacterized protein n=1 Tax=Melampsora larici-populina (strain 98AG31 / pathotype 3-4-7) TaxID=747676 RepID=F4SD65_MELLP|nr:uncharacterized protein MELLADRAFT_114362 [Melampsora larici-populina 98AG31]EGF97414.1 hypothetical protein MELLADRAFT_114362 [Melampsora larici-populina 98AG31]
MSSKANSTSSRRSVRQIKNPHKHRRIGGAAMSPEPMERKKTRKRKNETDLQTDANQTTSGTIKTSLEDLGVSVGANTTRERLLELLDSRSKTKRPRLSGDRRRIGSKKVDEGKKAGFLSSTNNQVAASGSTIDFSIYHTSDLKDMLQKVGMDTNGLDKNGLIQSCKTHSELTDMMLQAVLLPDFLVSIPPSASTIRQQPDAGPSRTVDPGEKFPSLERGRLTFPRPKPTILNPIVTSKDRKGKGKAPPLEDEDWTPENEVSSPSSEVDDCVRNISNTKTYKNLSSNPHESCSNTFNPNDTHPDPIFEGSFDRNQGTEDPSSSNPHQTLSQNRDPEDPNLASTVAKQTRTIARLNLNLTKTNARIEALESERDESEESGTRSGGRIAVSLIVGSQLYIVVINSNTPCVHQKCETVSCAVPHRMYREENWDVARKQKAADEVRRSTRMRHGRPSRLRIRGDDRPLSRIEAPEGLPVDCYSDEWLSTLSAVQRDQLHIHTVPVL